MPYSLPKTIDCWQGEPVASPLLTSGHVWALREHRLAWKTPPQPPMAKTLGCRRRSIEVPIDYLTGTIISGGDHA
ncbi:hypothetical protein HZU77_015655 [Neisseriaceae bacterium TC5R-5]|nr:hypothetical protein [Neisseriaceae bacterium TC5R-5]